MVALADIVPPSDAGVSVTIHGQKVVVTGVGVAGVTMLLNRYPELSDLFVGKDIKVTPDRIFEVVPDAVTAVIAAGLGSPGDSKAEAIAGALPISEQVAILNKVLEVTLPKGIGPFVEDMRKLMGVVSRTADFTTARATNSRSPAKG